MTILLASLILACCWWLFLAKTCGVRRLSLNLDQCSGHLIEIGLYKDAPKTIWESFRDLCAASFGLARLLILPSLLMAIPLLPALGWLSSQYTLRPLRVGESSLVSVRSESSNLPDFGLELPAGLSLRSEAVKDDGEIFWRVQAEEKGSKQLYVTWREERYSKTLEVSDSALAHLSPERSSSWLQWLRCPSEAKLSSRAPMESIQVHYPSYELWLGDRRWHWLVPFCLSFLLCLALTKRFFH